MNRKVMLGVALALAAGLGAGWLLFGGAHGGDDGGGAPAVAAGDGPCAGGKPPLFWRNPMNPSVTSPTFQKDSMGMDYIPVCAEESSGGGRAPAGTVKIDPTVEQNIGVRLAPVVRKEVSRTITTVGRVTYDETRLVTLHPKVEGWVERLFVDKTGAQVQQGTMLLSYYAPQLVATEQEYLLALANWRQLKSSPYADIRDGARRLLASSLERLRFFDVPEHQIRALERTHRVRKNLHIHSPAAGVVTKIGVREGAHVTPKSELYQIADLSRVWVLADLYQYEIGWVRKGDRAELTVASLPGRKFTGRISYIYPYLDARTRTNKVRLEFDNADGLLKPEMFGDVRIVASRRKTGLFVPRAAVLITGKGAHLFVQRAPGRFEPRSVETGARVDGMIEIRSGVQDGELVVTSGQFLIDSESSIREAAAKMVAPKQPDTGGMSMEGMSMEGMKMTPSKGSGMKTGGKPMDGSR
ncbi:MAG: efflux RND transporter periplasmic adaptor subunit [Zetaproteobacteria bacterium]|nr:MAG: efflux RND transporter periplasmic adaptor subunit [Zetaproteobacteria bacterium]